MEMEVIFYRCVIFGKDNATIALLIPFSTALVGSSIFSAYEFCEYVSLLYLDLHFDDNISWSYVERIQKF